MTIKLIATDMDDTLLNSQVEVSPRNRAAIKAAQEQGIIVMLATGRMYISAQAFAKRLGLDVPLVTYNGGLVKGSISEKVYFEKKLQLTTAVDVLSYARQQGYYLQEYVDDKLYIYEHNAFSAKYAAIAKIEATAIGEALYHPTQAPNKLLIMTTAEEFQAAWQDLVEHFAGRVDLTSSKDNFLEVMEPGVNKWAAVKAVGELYNIKPEEIMCCGDSNNDILMVQNAGIGVAVANAKPQVKEVAKIITADNNADGVALAIEQILTQQINVPL